MKRFLVPCIGVMALLSLAAPASAIEIVGTIGFSGSITYDTLNTSGGAILDFAPPGGGTGTAITVFSQSGYFDGGADSSMPNDGVTGATTARILDLTNVLAASGSPGPAYAPAGVPLTITGFLSLFSDADAGALRFDLTRILIQPGTDCGLSLAVGQTCVIGPFSITQTAGGIRIDFDVLGNFVRGADSGFFQGSFSTTFTNLNYATLLDRLDNTGLDLMCGTNNLTSPCSFDANFVNAVPEPLTLVTFGTGALLLALRRRRRLS